MDKKVTDLDLAASGLKPSMQHPIPLIELLEAFSFAMELMDQDMSGHHVKTCYIACRIAEECNIDEFDRARLFAAAIMHDIGAVALSSFDKESGHDNDHLLLHAEVGYILLREFEPFQHFATIVRHHHVIWDDGKGRLHNGAKVEDVSHMLALANAVSVIETSKGDDFVVRQNIRDYVQKNSRKLFKPDIAEAFLKVSSADAFWLDLQSTHLSNIVMEMSEAPTVTLDQDGLMTFAKFYSRLIDTRSRFTSSHSCGVAAVAAKAGEILGLDEECIQKLTIAGYLHDLGKLAIPKEILEKNGPLDKEERQLIRCHSYHTKRILERVTSIADIADWAANHHETPNGNGYPFGLAQTKLDMESRLLAVADVFTALRERRPYREGMDEGQIKQVLNSLAEKGELDRTIVELFNQHFSEIDHAQNYAREQDVKDLNFFWDTVRQSIRKPLSEEFM